MLTKTQISNTAIRDAVKNGRFIFPARSLIIQARQYIHFRTYPLDLSLFPKNKQNLGLEAAFKNSDNAKNLKFFTDNVVEIIKKVEKVIDEKVEAMKKKEDGFKEFFQQTHIDKTGHTGLMVSINPLKDAAKWIKSEHFQPIVIASFPGFTGCFDNNELNDIIYATNNDARGELLQQLGSAYLSSKKLSKTVLEKQNFMLNYSAVVIAEHVIKIDTEKFSASAMCMTSHDYHIFNRYAWWIDVSFKEYPDLLVRIVYQEGNNIFLTLEKINMFLGPVIFKSQHNLYTTIFQNYDKLCKKLGIEDGDLCSKLQTAGVDSVYNFTSRKDAILHSRLSYGGIGGSTLPLIVRVLQGFKNSDKKTFPKIEDEENDDKNK